MNTLVLSNAMYSRSCDASAKKTQSLPNKLPFIFSGFNGLVISQILVLAVVFEIVNFAILPAATEAQSLNGNWFVPFIIKDFLPCNSNQFSHPSAPATVD